MSRSLAPNFLGLNCEEGLSATPYPPEDYTAGFTHLLLLEGGPILLAFDHEAFECVGVTHVGRIDEVVEYVKEWSQMGESL